MELARQIVSNDQTVRSNTVQDLQNSTLNLCQHKLKRGTVSFYDAFY